MKTVVLAAGEGRRLKPLTDIRPKPMLPVANKPLLEYVVEATVGAGIEELVIVVGYQRERIQSHFGDGDDWNIDIEYVIQDKQLGTGHAILQAEHTIEEPFLVLNGDRIIESEVIKGMVEIESAETARLAVTRSDQPSDYGVVEIEGESVRSITEKPPRSATTSDLINAGVYRFGTDIFEVLRDTETEGELTVIAALQSLIAADRVKPLRYDGFWLDVSYLWDYITVNAKLLDRVNTPQAASTKVEETSYVAEKVAVGADTTIKPNATILPGSSLGDNVSIGPNTVLANSIVLPDATIQAGTVLQDCIIGENATVGPNTTVEGGITTGYAEGIAHEDVRLGGVVGDNARLGGNVTIAPATTIGTGATVEGGSHVEGQIPSDADVRRG